MKLKLSAIVVLAISLSAPARAATLTDAEATFLDQLVTAGAVLAQRCTGYEVNGAGGVQLQNGNGVILQLSGPKVGVELSAALGGVTISMR